MWQCWGITESRQHASSLLGWSSFLFIHSLICPEFTEHSYWGTENLSSEKKCFVIQLSLVQIFKHNSTKRVKAYRVDFPVCVLISYIWIPVPKEIIPVPVERERNV